MTHLLRQRPRWEVRRFGWNVLAATYGLPCTPHLLGTSVYRWRWLARAAVLLSTFNVAGQFFWAEVRPPDYTGARVLGPYGQYGLPASRAERGQRNCSYRPHQGGREIARRVSR